MNIKLIIEKFKKVTNSSSNTELSRKLGLNSSAVNNWLSRGSLNFETLLEYAVKHDFDLNYLFKSDDTYQESELFRAIEEQTILNLKRFKKIDRKEWLNYFNVRSEFITRHLKKLDDKREFELNLSNAKQQMIEYLQTVEISKFLDSETKRKNIIAEVEKEFSNLECYVMLKYPSEFI